LVIFTLEITLINFDNNLNRVLSRIKGSYQILEHLNDVPGDLEIINKELAKINGLLQVIVKKLENIDNSSDKYVKLSSAAKFYLQNYSFERELETMSKLYSDDPNRLKNIRNSILESLQDKKLMKKIESIIDHS
jgi:hypothetical protein